MPGRGKGPRQSPRPFFIAPDPLPQAGEGANSGASSTVPVGGSTLWRARGKLARVRRAAPRPARHPLGGSAHVLVRRGAVMSLGGSACVLARRGAVIHPFSFQLIVSPAHSGFNSASPKGTDSGSTQGL